jgi:Methyltransferase domain
MRWRLPQLAYPEHIAVLDHPIDPKPRYGYGHPAHEGLYAIMDKNRARYERIISHLAVFEQDIRGMARLEGDAGDEPTFDNVFFTGLDAIMLYYMVASRKPPRIFEIGSGFSTRFARRAARDHSPATRIISCDPHPRSDIDELCDVVVRHPLEEIGAAFVEALQPGDMLFVDSSHRCYTNSDVCIVFLEILPALPPGTIVHFHDIFLPYDYPPAWMMRYYTEQYLLACFMLSNPGKFELLFPGTFIGRDRDLQLRMRYLWEPNEMHTAFLHMERLYLGYGSFSFWFEIAAESSGRNGPCGQLGSGAEP